MYIQNLTEDIDDAGYQGMVDPNIVSGADFDERLDYMDYHCNYYDYDGDNPELKELHEKIQKAIAEVAEAKPKMEAAKERLKEVQIALQAPNMTQEQRMSVRADYSKVTGEISKLDTYINAREKGSIMGMKMQFEQIAGEPYSYEAPKPEIEQAQRVSGAGVAKPDLFSKIGSQVGLKRSHTIFALGGIAVLGIVLLTRKK